MPYEVEIKTVQVNETPNTGNRTPEEIARERAFDAVFAETDRLIAHYTKVYKLCLVGHEDRNLLKGLIWDIYGNDLAFRYTLRIDFTGVINTPLFFDFLNRLYGFSGDIEQIITRPVLPKSMPVKFQRKLYEMVKESLLFDDEDLKILIRDGIFPADAKLKAGAFSSFCCFRGAKRE